MITVSGKTFDIKHEWKLKEGFILDSIPKLKNLLHGLEISTRPGFTPDILKELEAGKTFLEIFENIINNPNGKFYG